MLGIIVFFRSYVRPHLDIITFGIGISCIISYYLRYQKSDLLGRIPLVGGASEKSKRAFVQNALSFLKEGYEKYPHGAYKVYTPNGFVVMVSREFLDELKSLPEDHADFYSANEEMVLSKFTRIERDPLIVDTIKNDLTGNLAKVMPAVIEEAEYALDTELPRSEGSPNNGWSEQSLTTSEWTSFPVYAKVTRIIALIAGRTFIGLPISRNEEWIRSQIDYPAEVFHAASRLKKYPRFLRPVVYGFLSEFRRLFGYYATAQRLILPSVKDKARRLRENDISNQPDVASYVLRNAHGALKQPYETQAKSQLTAALGTIHTSSGALTHCLYDLATRPEYIAPLRREVLLVLEEEGGTLAKKAMSKLKKLDSFLKESLRLNPPNQIAFLRRALKDIELSNGITIPRGAFFAVPASCISMDPTVWERPEDFDGFRFAKLRESSAEDANRYQFVTTSFNSLHFGYGKHACPGRFFASNQLKTVLALLLKDYDLSLEETDQERPPNLTVETQVLPNLTKTIRIRRIKVGK